jgi:hypothetical protein
MSTSQEQIYDAIRKADAAGDKDSVIKLGQYLSTMKDTQSHDDAKSAPKERGTVGKAFDAAGNFLSGVGDAGGVLATSAVAPVVAGVAGAGKAAYNVGARALGGHPDDAADTVEGVQNALSYQPRTQGGREYVEGITTPLRLLGEGADKAGAYTAEKTGSPLLGAGVNTAIQMLPGLVAPELSGKGPLGARIAARAAEARQPPAPAGAAPGATTAPPGATPAAPGATPLPAGATAPLNTAARQTAAQRAEAYVRDRAGVDWNSLSAGLKETITQIAQDSASLDKLDPKAVARKARADAANLPVTRGQAERNLAQLTREENLVKSDAGQGIRDTKANQDTRLHELVDDVRKATGAKAETRSQVGESVQNTGLRAKIRQSKANYDRLYKVARDTEPEAEAPAKGLFKFLGENPSVQHVGWLGDWLRKAKVEIPEGGDTPNRGVKLDELDDLRKRALRANKPGSPDAHYAGEVIKAIDDAFEHVPTAAKAWTAAREAFKTHKIAYDDTGINKSLGTDRSRIDRRVKLEKTTDKIVGSSREDIGQLKKTLGEDSQEWKDVRGGVIDKLKQAATGKREIDNEQGTTQFNSSFRNLFNELDKDGKIDEIFSPAQAQRLRDINQLVADVRTTPSGRIAGSDTVPRLVSLLDKVEAIPGVGGIVKTAAGAVTKAYRAGEAARQVRRAGSDPLKDSAKQATKAVKKRRNVKAAESAAPAFAPTIGDAINQEQPPSSSSS